MGATHADIIRRWFLNDTELKGGYRSLCAEGQIVKHKGIGVDLAVRSNSGPFVMLNSDVISAPFNSCSYYTAEKVLGGNAIPFSFGAAKRLKIDISDVELIYKHKDVLKNRLKNVIFRHQDRILMTCSDNHWSGILEIDFIPKDHKEAHDGIIPCEVKAYKKYAEKYHFYQEMRQGEWWCIPRPKMNFKVGNIQKDVMVGGTNHRATYYVESENMIYAKGTLRHHPKSRNRGSWWNRHYRPWIRFGDCWHELHKSIFVKSASC